MEIVDVSQKRAECMALMKKLLVVVNAECPELTVLMSAAAGLIEGSLMQMPEDEREYARGRIVAALAKGAAP